MEELKTCHQCRQRTQKPMATCKNLKDRIKPCTLKFCERCLLNRYEEKFEEVEQLDDWKCPRCREDCNCSVCRKRKGIEPTGKVARTAKAEGYSSVSKLLSVKSEQYLKRIGTSNNVDTTTLEKDTIIVPSRKQGISSNEVPKQKRKITKKEGKWASKFASLKHFLDDDNEITNKGMKENMAKTSKIQEGSSTLKDDGESNMHVDDASILKVEGQDDMAENSKILDDSCKAIDDNVKERKSPNGMQVYKRKKFRGILDRGVVAEPAHEESAQENQRPNSFASAMCESL